MFCVVRVGRERGREMEQYAKTKITAAFFIVQNIRARLREEK